MFHLIEDNFAVYGFEPAWIFIGHFLLKEHETWTRGGEYVGFPYYLLKSVGFCLYQFCSELRHLRMNAHHSSLHISCADAIGAESDSAFSDAFWNTIYSGYPSLKVCKSNLLGICYIFTAPDSPVPKCLRELSLHFTPFLRFLRFLQLSGKTCRNVRFWKSQGGRSQHVYRRS